MFKKGVIMGIYSVTPVHAGSGNELSYIDLPIQRERHTGYPVIWGQSLKGVLRDAYDKSREDDMIDTEIVFGPEKGSKEYMGCISVGDAKILLFPVRSAKGLFVYVTSPIVLKRFKEDIEYLGKEIKDFKVSQFNEDDILYTTSESDFVGNIEGKAILEDMVFKVRAGSKLTRIFEIISNISPMNIDENRIALISDNMFGYFVKNTTEVLARVAIDDDKGTVKPGALWWEEYLPTDTLMYSIVLSKEYKKKDKNGEFTTKHDADAILKSITKFAQNNKYVQVGGNSTVGKGICKIKIWGGENGES